MGTSFSLMMPASLLCLIVGNFAGGLDVVGTVRGNTDACCPDSSCAVRRRAVESTIAFGSLSINLMLSARVKELTYSLVVVRAMAIQCRQQKPELTLQRSR